MISELIVHQANGDSVAFEHVLEKAVVRMDAESGGEVSFKDSWKKFEADRERKLRSEEARKTAPVCVVVCLLHIMGPESIQCVMRCIRNFNVCNFLPPLLALQHFTRLSTMTSRRKRAKSEDGAGGIACVAHTFTSRSCVVCSTVVGRASSLWLLSVW
jgi:hypothetical protein